MSAKLKAAMPSEASTNSIVDSKSNEDDKAVVAKATKTRSVKAEKKESKVVNAEEKKEASKPTKRRVVKSAEFSDGVDEKMSKSKRVSDMKATKLEDEGRKTAVLAALQRINEINVTSFSLNHTANHSFLCSILSS